MALLKDVNLNKQLIPSNKTFKKIEANTITQRDIYLELNNDSIIRNITNYYLILFTVSLFKYNIKVYYYCIKYISRYDYG